ncbi:MAG: nuclease [Candidatus Sulfotelmatobacter sp.]|nr:nuclease [Candidatus Sulfotelmatobacter sp.]
MNGSTDFVFSPGQVYRRRELHDKFGGQRQGGISTPAKVPFVFLITGDSGKQHGYSDEWTEDGVFLYTGEGQHGDMRFAGGNRAIRDHLKNAKALQVFEQDKKDKRFLRYLGEMEYTQHAFRDAPDTDGKRRKAIVFHLRPVGTLSPDSAVVAAALADEGQVSKRGAGGGFGSVETNRRVEKAAIDFVKRRYEEDGWSVRSVEAQKVGYDLCCEIGSEQAHLEVKGTQGDDVCFIITAAEVRNAMIDRRHLTCVVTAALTPAPKMFTYTRAEFSKKIQLEPIAFRAQLLGEWESRARL